MGPIDAGGSARRARRLPFLGIIGGLLVACSAFSSAPPEPTVLNGGPGGDAGGPAEPAEPPPPCDPNEAPGEAVYVSSAFGIAGGLGTADTPFKTIGEGLDAAAAKGVTRVIVDEGTYAERLAFTDRLAGITVVGGWKGSEVGWRRDCQEGFRSRTIVESPEPVAVSVEATSAGPASGLESMTITTKALDVTPPDTSGASSIGVLVRGPATFRLRIVKVVATSGGAGGAASPAAPATGQASCTGLPASCSNGAAGEAGMAGSAGVASFGPDGFVPGDGTAGTAGAGAANGTPGKAGTSRPCADVTVGECNTGTGICGIHVVTVSANPGRCGCGGLGGGGGNPGRGGGASVALLVLGSGTISIEHTNLTAVRGGDASSPTPGADGADGAAGRSGEPKECFTKPGQTGQTGPGCTCIRTGNEPVQGGAAGGEGGKGGKGGDGGGAAGGPAHAWVVVGTGKVVEDAASVFSVGPGGAGTGGAPNGASSKSLVVDPTGAGG